MLALLNPLAAGAQAVPEPQLRAAYLVNFLKYVEWPGGGATATICIYGRDTLSAHLAPYEGRSVQGRELLYAYCAERGMKSATHSTWWVIGKASKARRVTRS